MTTTLQHPGIRTAYAAHVQAHHRLRVCHVSMHLKTGGLERLLVEFGRAHDARSFDLTFVALAERGQPAEDLDALGCEVHSLEMPRHGKRRTLAALRRLFRNGRFDIVHTHNTYAHFYGTLAARAAGVPHVVNTQHGRGCGAGWKARVQFSLANRLTDQVFGVSDDAALLCRQQDPLSRGKIGRIWNGIDLTRFAWSGPRPEPVAISVARLSPEKDFSTLLRAVALAVPHVPGLRLKIVGDGVERPALDRLTRDLNIHGHVQFLGERNDVPQLLRQAGLFVSSSRTEGVSLTLLEAMAVGLPVLATRVGGNPEVVDDGVTGRLVPPQDHRALSAALVALCRDSELRSTMGALARTRVAELFDVRRIVEEYEDVYRTLGERRASAR
jgi:glycosyltransferase involved in cell wall biosynthesis